MRPVSREIQRQQRENSFCKTYTKHKNHKQVVFHTQNTKKEQEAEVEDEEPNTPRRYSWKKLTQTAKSSRGFSPRFSFLHFSTVLCGIFSARLGVNLMEKYAPANKSFALFIFFCFSLRIYELSIVFKVIQFFSGGLANSANELRHCATTQ